MSKPTITIIGLGLTGTSMGLALQRESGNFVIIGHDKDYSIAGQAKKQGAVHRTEWNLHNACDGADMIIVAIPMSELAQLFIDIAEDLKPGCLLLCIVNVMQPTLSWAAERLPDHAHFVVGHPILTGVDGPLHVREDLFDDTLFCLAPGLKAETTAVQLASDFVGRLGAEALFVDATEHDGIIAGVEQLPQLLAAALVYVSSRSPGWVEARRMAGRVFAQSTQIDPSAEQLFSAFQANRENLLQRISLVQGVLTEWQELLSQEPGVDADKLQDSNTKTNKKAEANKEADSAHPLLIKLKRTLNQRADWAISAKLKRWDDTTLTLNTERNAEKNTGMLRQMFMGSLFGGRGDKMPK